MKKEQYTLRMLPITKISLEKERQEKGVKDLNVHINSILEDHITKKNKEENFNEKFKELEERNKQLEEKITTNFILFHKLLTRIVGSVEK